MGTGDHNAGLASHPGRSSNISSHFTLQILELSTSLMGLLAHMQTLFPNIYCLFGGNINGNLTFAVCRKRYA